MRKGNRVTVFILSALMACLLAGCGDKKQPETEAPTTQEVTTEKATTEEPTTQEPTEETTESTISEDDGEKVPKVKVNQAGYGRKDKKIAVFADLDEDDTTFTVVEADTNKVVFKGKLSEQVENVSAGEKNCTGDFSELKEVGTYKVVSGKGEESYSFTIGENVHENVFRNALCMFYLQRCGQELDEEHAGDFAHPECHSEEACLYGTEQKIDVSGGWHDTGSYERSVVFGAKATADLMLAYEKNPEAFSDETGIPESGNGVSDVLDEVRYELEWMLKMQNQESGGVYHKVGGGNVSDVVMPQGETEELTVAPISNTATGDFAAVMAMASRVYQKVDRDFAQRCIVAAENAWFYLEEHQSEENIYDSEKSLADESQDISSADEMFWAAAELCKTTDDVVYVESVKELYPQMKSLYGFGWKDVSGYGAYAALTSEALALDSSNFPQDLKTAFLKEAEQALTIAKKNPYMVRKIGRYERGSNMGIANMGLLLYLANEIEPKETYVEYAKNHLNYLFGVNATGYCFVTGEGTLSPENPCHKPSQVLEKTMPGMLVGGPDSDLEDTYAEAVFIDTPVAKCYVDDVECSACNGVAVYWNAPLIYLLAAEKE